jgi:hypothetical protein
MARLRLAPFILIAALAALAWVGKTGRAYNTAPHVRCVYILAERDTPAADVLLVGSSRIGRGLDPGYMMARIADQTGQDIMIERLALTQSAQPQYRPLVSRYIAHRKAPKYAFVQLLYNFVPNRQRSWDTPINSPRNVAHANVSELVEIQMSAVMNDFDTFLPRWSEAAYVTTPALILQNISTDIYAGLRYPAQTLRGRTDVCRGERIYKQRENWHYNSLSDDIVFAEDAAQKTRRLEDEKTAAGFLPIAATSAQRTYENSQLRPLLAELSEAGSTVFIMIMPSLGQRSISAEEIAGLEQAFPEYPVVHPFSIYKGELGDQLAVSFGDTHHPTDFGAMLFSRYFADYMSGLDF